jgi:dihydroorotase-like cyclic amidohydrolase
MWKAIGAAVAAALVMVGIMYWVMQEHQQPVIVNVEAIKKIAQLATIEYHISIALPKAKEKKFLEWKEATFFVFVKGKVKGSVDLNQAAIDIVNTAEEKLVKIKFKKGAILVSNPEIAEGDIRTVTCSSPNIFHPINDKDRNEAQNEAIGKIKQAAIDDGIQSKTAAEAKVVLTNFLQGLGYSAEIEFEDKSLKI